MESERVAEFREIGARVLARAAAKRHAEDMRRMIDETSRRPPTREALRVSLERRASYLEDQAEINSRHDVTGNYIREAENRAYAKQLRAEAAEIRERLVPEALRSLDPVMQQALAPVWIERE